MLIGFYTKERLDKIKEAVNSGNEPQSKAYKSLKEYTDKRLKNDFAIDEDYNVPGYYVDAEGHGKGKINFNAVGCMAYASALAYAISGDAVYAEKSTSLLLAWAKGNKTVSGYDGPLSMSYVGPSFVYAAEILTLSGGWTDAESEIFKAWLKTIFIPTADSIRDRHNNWGDWGLLASTVSYNYLGDTEALKICAEMARKRIDSTIKENGEMPHETVRQGNGIWYTYFALAPMTATCCILRNTMGLDLFNYKGEEGQCIKNALDYLLYYYENPDKWPHFEGNQNFTTGRSDWPYNLFEVMGRIYGNEDYLKFAAFKEINSVTGHHYAWSFTTLTTI